MFLTHLRYVLLLACLVYLGHGRRLHISAEQLYSNRVAVSHQQPPDAAKTKPNTFSSARPSHEKLRGLRALLVGRGLVAAFNSAARVANFQGQKHGCQHRIALDGLPCLQAPNPSLRQSRSSDWERQHRGGHINMVAAPPPVTTDEEDKEINSDINADISLEADAEDTYRSGLITVAIITVLFASNSPAVHEAFVAEPQLPPLLLNAAVAVIGLAGLLFSGDVLKGSTELPATLVVDEDDESAPLRAGLELGLWKFLGTTANLYGLSLTSADHGAFLIQLTTLFVPAAQGLMGVPIPRRIWTSIILALVGVFLFTQDPESVGASGQGDALCVLAAVLYATYDLRLFSWGKKVEPLPLISNKVAVQATLSILLLAVAAREQSIEFLTNLSPGGAAIIGSVAVWSGLVVNGLVPFIQVGGQQAIGPARAQVIYASQPLWAALLSLVLLHETVGLEGVAGGAAFITACFLAATAPLPDPECGEEVCEI